MIVDGYMRNATANVVDGLLDLQGPSGQAPTAITALGSVEFSFSATGEGSIVDSGTGSAAVASSGAETKTDAGTASAQASGSGSEAKTDISAVTFSLTLAGQEAKSDSGAASFMGVPDHVASVLDSGLIDIDVLLSASETRSATGSVLAVLSFADLASLFDSGEAVGQFVFSHDLKLPMEQWFWNQGVTGFIMPARMGSESVASPRLGRATRASAGRLSRTPKGKIS